MRLCVSIGVLTLLPAAAAQTTGDEPVRVSIAHLWDAGASESPLRFLPGGAARSLGALRAPSASRLDPRVLDVVGNLAVRRFGRDARPRISVDGTDLVASGGAVEREKMRNTMLDALSAFAPAVSLEVGVWRGAPAPPPPVLAARDFDRDLPGRALYSAHRERAAGESATFELDGPDDERLQLRVQAHVLEAGERVALLCEFALSRRARDGARRWSAGTASGTIAADGGLVVGLRDRIVVVRAKPATRAAADLAGASWSLLTTRGLRGRPEWTGDAELLRVVPGHPIQHPDVILQWVKDEVFPAWWDVRGGIAGDPGLHRMLLSGAPERLAKATPAVVEALAELAAPWTETALIECEVSGPTDPAIIRVPALPGRIAAVFDAAWSADGSTARGTLVALDWRVEDESDRSRASGIAALTRGADATGHDRAPLRFDVVLLEHERRATLVEAKPLFVGLSRSR